jgi:hypothetical protein
VEEPHTFSIDPLSERFVDVLWTFEPVEDELRTFELAYTLKNVIYRDPAGDSLLLWAVTNRLEFMVYDSTVTVHLPQPLVAEPNSRGAPVQWETSPDAKTITYVTERGILRYEGITIDLVMAHDPAAPKSEWQLAQEQVEVENQRELAAQRAEEERQRLFKAQVDVVAGAITLALLLLVPGGLYVVWYLWGRDPSAGLAPDYLSEPPSNLPPGLVGVLVDEKADMRDISATVIDLARRGHLILEEVESKNLYGLGTALQVKKTNAQRPQGLRHYESVIYTNLFGTQDSVRFDTLPYEFFEAMPGIEQALYEESVTEGLFRTSPGAARSQFRGLGITTIVIGIVVGLIAGLGWGYITTGVMWPAFPVVLFGIGLMVLGPAMPARTRKGAEEAARWRAFQKYLGNIKQYGNIETAAARFDAYLPYAVAFGLERRWVSAFTEPPTIAGPKVAIPMPQWYRIRSTTTSTPVSVPSIGGTPAMGSTPSAAGSIGSSPIGSQSSGGTPAAMPNLNSIGEGLASGLNNLGTNFAQSLNIVGDSLATPRVRPSATSDDWLSSLGGGSNSSNSSGSWGGSSSHRSSSSRSSFGSSRGSSGGRSSSGSSRSSSSRSSSRPSGGGRRGFR